MNKLFALTVIAVAITGCSTAVTNSNEQIRNQKLSTSFVGEGIRIETNCAWYKPWKNDCEIVFYRFERRRLLRLM